MMEAAKNMKKNIKWFCILIIGVVFMCSEKFIFGMADQNNIKEINDEDENEFYISQITNDIFARIKGKSYKDKCTLPLEDLRYLHVLHKDINGEIKEGEIICNVYIA